MTVVNHLQRHLMDSLVTTRASLTVCFSLFAEQNRRSHFYTRLFMANPIQTDLLRYLRVQTRMSKSSYFDATKMCMLKRCIYTYCRMRKEYHTMGSSKPIKKLEEAVVLKSTNKKPRTDKGQYV